MRAIVAVGGHARAPNIGTDASTNAGLHAPTERKGHIEGLLNTAGCGHHGAVEGVAPGDVRRRIEVNIFGLARMIGIVLPALCAQQAGTIITTCSAGGMI